MAHDVTKQYNGQIGMLTIRSKSASRSLLQPTYGEVTKLGRDALGGIRIKVRDADTENRISTLDIRGEDLYALREFLAELPEEAFVRPAEPIQKPERWTDGDVITWLRNGETQFVQTYARRGGEWWIVAGNDKSGGSVSDALMSSGVMLCPDVYRIVRQASGQDLSGLDL